MIIAAMLLLASASGDAEAAPKDAQTAPTTQGQVAQNEPQVKCVREAITGSVARTRKVCHTVNEWAQIRYNAEGEARRITQPGSPTINN